MSLNEFIEEISVILRVVKVEDRWQIKNLEESKILWNVGRISLRAEFIVMLKRRSAKGNSWKFMSSYKREWVT